MAAGGPAPAGLDAHLADCLHCARELASLRQLLTIADDELRLSATCEPSAGFVPRLRAAVMESGSVPLRRSLWYWPSLGIAAAVLVAVMLFMTAPPREQPVMAIRPSQPLPSVPATPEPEPALEPARESGTVARLDTPARIPPRAAQRVAPTEPEVLVPPGQSQALIEFIRIVNREKIMPTALATSGEPPTALAPPVPITLTPIEIVPLDSAMNIGT